MQPCKKAIFAMTALRATFITGVGAFLPGEPVTNDRVEDVIGRIGGRPSAIARRALGWNGIEQRHYALAPDGTWGWTNASMTAEAVRAALDDAGRDVGDLQHLATATTQGDLLVPGHASAVHAELDAGPLETASFQSVCASALMAAKSAWQAVRTGEAECAAAAAGEFSSRWFRPVFYEGTRLIDAKGRLAMEADFLRWTLSDGAGAIVLAPRPAPRKLSLRVDWIDIVSLADRFAPCMWAGAARGSEDDPEAAWSRGGPAIAHAAGAVALMQDFQRLKGVVRAFVGVILDKVDRGRIVPAAVDHLLCHYSARSLRQEIVRLLERTRAMIPEERWFTNLATCGNTGSASIWIMLHGLMATGRVAPGERILAVVPESGRATLGLMHMTAVEAA
jgi:3-oxoacyl-[acyl-carrier-protein] synthase-3